MLTLVPPLLTIWKCGLITLSDGMAPSPTLYCTFNPELTVVAVGSEVEVRAGVGVLVAATTGVLVAVGLGVPTGKVAVGWAPEVAPPGSMPQLRLAPL